MVNYSFGQRRSIKGLATAGYEAVALSDDKLQSLLKAGDVKSSDYRIIYESEVIPRFTIGLIYNLRPQLAEKVKQAILDFKNEGAPAQESSASPMSFFAVNYKKDFEFVRKMDESFGPRLGYEKEKSKAGAGKDNQP